MCDFVKKEKNSSLKLGTYPYVNTRVRVMKSKLIDKNDYSKLLKMSHDEISKFIADVDYRKEMDELAVNYTGADLLELAINANAVKSFSKIIRLSSGDAKKIIAKYLKRFDVLNLKTILRGVYSGGLSEVELKENIIPGGQLLEKSLLDLLKNETIDDVIKDKLVLSVFPYLKDYVAPADGITLASIENYIDVNYYAGLFKMASLLPKSASVFKIFLENEIDMININTILILKKENLDATEIKSMILCDGIKFGISKKVLDVAMSAENFESALDVFEKSEYSKEIALGKEDAINGNFGVIRRELDSRLMKKAFLLLHQNPLSIAPVLGYILAKEIEIKNLKMISRAKELDLPEEFMEKNLIVA